MQVRLTKIIPDQAYQVGKKYSFSGTELKKETQGALVSAIGRVVRVNSAEDFALELSKLKPGEAFTYGIPVSSVDEVCIKTKLEMRPTPMCFLLL